jgi:putative transposase
MKQAGIAAKMQKLFKHTTQVKIEHQVAINILQQNFTAQAPNQVWVSDISYNYTMEGWELMSNLVYGHIRRLSCLTVL